METVAEATARLAAWDATCATVGPALSMTFEGQQMTFATPSERDAARAVLMRRLTEAKAREAGKVNSHVRWAVVDKGFD
jgi:hypothetical protein